MRWTKHLSNRVNINEWRLRQFAKKHTPFPFNIETEHHDWYVYITYIAHTMTETNTGRELIRNKSLLQFSSYIGRIYNKDNKDIERL